MTAENQSPKVLVVEDSMPLRRMLVKIVSSKGVTAVEAGDGEQALAVLDETPPTAFSLIMLDLMMPVMDGPNFLTAARAKYGDDLPPVLIVSSRSDREAIQSVRDLGVAGYVLKPFKADTILSKVSEFIENNNLTQ